MTAPPVMRVALRRESGTLTVAEVPTPRPGPGDPVAGVRAATGGRGAASCPLPDVALAFGALAKREAIRPIITLQAPVRRRPRAGHPSP